jgi:hypothetical protein
MSKNSKTSQQETTVDLVFEALILDTYVLVECINRPVSDIPVLWHTNTFGMDTKHVKLHISQPHASDMGKMIACVNKKSSEAMSVFRNNLSNSDTETRHRHIDRVLLKLCRSEIQDFNSQRRPIFLHGNKTTELTLTYKDQVCFRMQMQQLFDSYVVQLHKSSSRPHEVHGLKFGNYTTGQQLVDHLNVADMVQWVVHNLSPHVRACMTP